MSGTLPTVTTEEPLPETFVKREVLKQIALRYRLTYLLNNLTVTPPEQQPCSICQDISGKWCQLPTCTHTFHGACVVRWLMLHDYCPICRSKV